MTKLLKTSTAIDTINEIISTGRSRNLLHLNAENETFNGRDVQIDGKNLINFGSCSYLGLEMDDRLKQGAIDAIIRYGSQFACSRAYISCPLYNELEGLLGQMFDAPLLVSTTTSMGHQAVIPIVVEAGDAVILDQQAHFSMQSVVQNLTTKGVTVSYIRHNNIDELDNKLKELSPKHSKIWYFIDGVYSMYGDYAPIDAILELMEQNRQLYLYADDAHGISWGGVNGTGNVYSKLAHHQRVIFTTSMGKGFANAGGIFVFPTEEMKWKVKNWGGPLTHSGPHPPSVLGASIASAKIHLTDEINIRQNELITRIQYCNTLLKQYNLPLITEAETPVFFVGLGLTKVAYNMVNRLTHDGLYINLAVYPAVPMTCSGIRFTITTHHSFSDIEKLVESIAYHLPLALEEEGRNVQDIYRTFKTLKFKTSEYTSTLIKNSPFQLQYENTIDNIPKRLWDSLFSSQGIYDWEGLRILENSFKGNGQKHENWDFHYYVIRNNYGKIVAATFFTEAYSKDDLFSPTEVSRHIETLRKDNQYYLTSKSLMMGTLISEGEHLYIDREYPDWKQAFTFLLDHVWKQQDLCGCDGIFLRDFDARDIEIRDLLMDTGFVKVQLPLAHTFINFNWENPDGFLMQLPGKKRNKLRKEVLSFEDNFDVAVVTNLNDTEIEHAYQLYNNVAKKNLAINSFPLPMKFFKELALNPNVEILQLRFKENHHARVGDLPIAIGFVYKAKAAYCPVILGLDYDFVAKYSTYRQMLYQAILRARKVGMEKIFFGFSADEEKQKFAAKSESKVAFVQLKDNYNSTVINMIPNYKESKPLPLKAE